MGVDAETRVAEARNHRLQRYPAATHRSPERESARPPEHVQRRGSFAGGFYRQINRSSVPAGFTLLELTVVLAIAALLLAVTPPLITAALPGVELKASARRVTAGLRLAREEAIRTGRDISFVLDVENRTYRVDGDFRPRKLSDRLTLNLEAAETEMRSDQQGGVRFFPDGSSTGGRILLSIDDRGFQVGVQWLTGRIRMAPFTP